MKKSLCYSGRNSHELMFLVLFCLYAFNWSYAEEIKIQKVQFNLVNLLPVLITDHPTSQVFCSGGNANFSVTAQGTNLTYQWRKNGVNLINGGNISGAMDAILNISPATSADAGFYDVIVSDCCASETSAAATLVINDPANITSHPSSQSACEGSNVSFTVTASGTNLVYQWRKNGSNITNGGNISGATSTTLTLTGVLTTDAGNYDVVISNTSCPSATSNTASLTIGAGTAITDHPSSMVLCSGGNASFNVVATGTNLTYQWKKNGVTLSNGGVISGGTTATLTLTGATSVDAGFYDVEVTGSCGTEPSAAATLVINDPANITSHPSSQLACEGSNVSFSVTATGTNLVYQWRKNGVNLSNGGNISGATSTTLNITGVLTTDAGSYDVVISNTSCPSTTSNTASLTIGAGTAITDHPSSMVLCSGGNASFSVVASGTNLTYQWKKNGVALNNGGVISGATSATLTLTGATSVDAGFYDVEVTGACGTEPSAAATLVINNPANITLQPSSQLACEGTNVSFSVTATGTNLVYQWRKNGVNLSNGGNISGATSTTLNITGVLTTDAGSYDVVISNTACPSATSSTASLTIGAGTAITDHPSSMVLCSGGNASFSVVATGTNLTYQWKKNGVNLSNGGVISGATSAALTLTGATSVDAGFYDVDVTGACGTEPSAAATLVINNPANITSHPSTQLACEGANVSFSVTATGTNLVYQWRKNGSNITNGGNISGATSTTLNISGVLTTDAGSYDVMISNTSCPSATSNTATLTIGAGTVITDHPSSMVLCSGGNASFSVLATGTNLTYQWKKNGINLNNGGVISGANAATLTLTGATSVDAGFYDVEVTGACGTEPSAAATLVINNPANITTHPSSQLVCEGANVSFTVTATGTNLVYQWRKNGSNITNGGNISGATSTTLNISGVLTTDAGSYDVVISNTSCTSATSNTASLTIGAGTVITDHPSSMVLCSGGNASFSVVATGTNLTYQWKKNGVNLSNGGVISGATSTTLTLTGATSVDAGFYDVEVTGNCGTEPSAAATLVINNPATINTHPSSQFACKGSNAVFTVSASGTNLVYQWRKNGVNLSNGGNVSGATSSTLTITGVNQADAGNYDVVISNTSCPSATSNTAILTVGNKPSPVITGAGNPCEFSIQVYTASGPVNDQYIWNVIGGNIVGFSTGNSIDVMWGAGGSGSVTVTQINSFGCDSTVVLTVTVSHNPVVTHSAFSSVCISDLPFTLSGGSPVGGTYSGPGVSSGIFDPVSAGIGIHTITYVYSNANGCTDSASANIEVSVCSTVPTTQLQAQYCSYLLTTMQDWVFSDIVQGATTYQYYVEEIGSANPLTAYYNRTSASSPNGFSLSWINGVKYNTTYSVQVRVKVGNNWGVFGPICYVTTPPTIPTPTINPQYCNITLNNIQDLIFVEPQWGAINYHYEITHSASGFIANYYRGSGSWAFSFSWVKGLLYDSTYTMRYRANINGIWSSFSSTCTFKLPPFPATQLQSQYCNIVFPSIDYLMSVASVINATNYYFTITDSSGFTVNYYRNSTSPLINLKWIPGLSVGTTYYIGVQAMQGSTFGPMGTICSVTIPSQVRFINNESRIVNSTIYPNPNNGSGFTININNFDDDKLVKIDIYDINGKLVWNKHKTHASSTLYIDLNNVLAPGLYTVSVFYNNIVEFNKMVIQK